MCLFIMLPCPLQLTRHNVRFPYTTLVLSVRRVSEERLLDFGRTNVDAARDDEVGAPVGKVEIAIGIEPADIADRFPPIGRGPPFGADIAIGRARPPGGHGEHFAFLPRLALLPVVAQDPEAPAADRTPDRTRQLNPFAPATPQPE